MGNEPKKMVPLERLKDNDCSEHSFLKVKTAKVCEHCLEWVENRIKDDDEIRRRKWLVGKVLSEEQEALVNKWTRFPNRDGIFNSMRTELLDIIKDICEEK